MTTFYTWDEFVAAAQKIELEGLTGDSCGCLLSAIARKISGAPFASVGYTNALLYERDASRGFALFPIGEIDADDDCWATVDDLITKFVRIAREYEHEEVTEVEVRGAVRRLRAKVYDPVPVERTRHLLAAHGIERED